IPTLPFPITVGMAFLIDSERPTTLDELTYHDSITQQLRGLARRPDLPHLLFYGPTGGGKMTRIQCLLREIFGPAVTKVVVVVAEEQSGGRVLYSNYHLEVTPTEAGTRDVVVIQHLIKEMAQAPPLGGDVPFRVVVVNDAHNLSRSAQAGLRRTMEKYVGVLKVFFHADSLASLIPPLRSRCMSIRVPRPTTEVVKVELERVEAKMGVEMNPHLATIIATESRGDLRYGLMQLDAISAQNGGSHALRNANTPLARLPWKVVVEDIVEDILTEQTPKQLKAIREKLYGLLEVHIPPSEICYHMLVLLGTTLENAEDSWPRLAALAARFEPRPNRGYKQIFNLEALIANIMTMCRALGSSQCR
ncbi:replication factor C subunit, putative, partial [Perkinsus marinus ATCC 50983]